MKHYAERGFRKNGSAVAPVVGVILLLAIMISIVGSILLWGVPLLRDMENDAKFDSARSNFMVLNSRTKELMQEGEGSSKTATISLPGGDMYIIENLERWVVYYSLLPMNVTFQNLTDGDAVFDFYFDNDSYNLVELNVTVVWRHNDTAVNYTTTNGRISADHPLSGSVSIFIYNVTANGSKPLAHAFMDNLGGIQYYQQLENQRVQIRAVNGGLVSDQGTSLGQVISSPLVVQGNARGSRTINVFLIDTEVEGIGSGSRGTFNIEMNYVYGEVLAARTVHNMNIMIDSPMSFGYYFYFLQNYDFLANNDESGQIRSVRFAPDFQSESFLVLNYAMLEIDTMVA